MRSTYDYFWGGVNFPHFYPSPDSLNPSKYIVEFGMICYPHRNGRRFDIEAFPPELREYGENGSTKFAFLMRDEQGDAYEELEWEDAARIADKLNDSYHFLINDCLHVYNWKDFPIAIDPDDIIYNK